MPGVTSLTGKVTTEAGSVVELEVPVDTAGNAKIGLGSAVAGEREPSSVTGKDYLATSEEWDLSAAVDLSVDAGATIYNGPCILGGFWLDVTIGTAAVDVKDNSTTKMTLPVAYAVGEHAIRPTKIYTSLKVLPGATSTGTIRFFYKPMPTNVTAA